MPMTSRPKPKGGPRPTNKAKAKPSSKAKPSTKAKPAPRAKAKPSAKPAARATGKPSAAPNAPSTERPAARPTAKPAAKSSPRPAAAPRTVVPKAISATRVKWSGFKVMNDFWGQPMKRYYQLETLASATEAGLPWRNSFVFRSVHEALGPYELLSLHFELFQEGRYQLIFRLRAVNTRGKSMNFAYVAAKNHEECTELAKIEHYNLRTLYQRMPKLVVQPYWGGSVILPDRHKRKEMDRHVYAYLTGWLNGYEELGVTRSLQFYVNGIKKHTFTLAETEELKGQALEVVAASYDEPTRTAMALPQIASGDFVVRREGGLALKLIACRKMQKNISRQKLLSQVLTESWDWGGRTFKLAPEEPATVLAALTRAWGADIAKAATRAYLDGVAAGRLPGKRPGYLADLRALCTEK